jgi:hypothetical protein
LGRALDDPRDVYVHERLACVGNVPGPTLLPQPDDRAAPPPIFVSEVITPPTVPPGTACSHTNAPSQPSLLAGVLDVALRNTYDASYLIGDRLESREDADPSISYINIAGATVRITDVVVAPGSLDPGHVRTSEPL